MGTCAARSFYPIESRRVSCGRAEFVIRQDKHDHKLNGRVRADEDRVMG